MKSKNVIFNTLIVVFLTFCVQFTDLKIGVVKVTELLALALIPILVFGKLHRHIIYFFGYFTVAALISLWVTNSFDFYHSVPSFFKRPYWITAGRYIEIVSCLVICNITYTYFKSLKNKDELDTYVSVFINLNLLITIVFAGVHMLVISNVISMNDTRLVYGWDTRLRGFFVEGGPYGLMLSFIFMLTSLEKNSRITTIIKRVILFAVILVMAKSKAGILSCVVWLAVENFQFLKNKLKPLLIPLAVVFTIGFIYLFTNLSSLYIYNIERIKTSVKNRPYDPNFMMGRISGFFIVPKMVQENPALGIGTGNYPLLRNNKEYRGFFPIPPKSIRNMDAHGYGGIVDILVDNGIIGLLFFFLIIGVLFIKVITEKGKAVLLVGFICLFSFGVQIHFMYPWMLLGLVLVSCNEQKVLLPHKSKEL